MYHSFDTEIARLYGVNEAIILNNIAFWVAKNEANKHNCFDGRYWTFNSAKAYSELFPYMSARTIQRVIKHLEDENLIMTGNFNADPRNRTNFYTLTDFGKEVTANWQVALRQVDVMQNDKVAECIFKNNTDSNTDINNTDINNICVSPVISLEESEAERMFNQFWEAYPNRRKVNKKGCKAKFLKIPDLAKIFPDILNALEIQKKSKDWTKDGGQFIPMPMTWLNQERWTLIDTRTEREQIAGGLLKNRLGNYF